MSFKSAAPFLIASIPAVAAVVSAIVAGRFAIKTKAREGEAQQIRDLENRISEKKYDVYKPMIDSLGNLFNAERAAAISRGEDVGGEFAASAANFSTWITIYGSDGTIRAFRNLMQGAFAKAPALILMRLYAEFVIAARRDIGYPDTQITGADLLGMRITDLHTTEGFLDALSQPFDALCKQQGWAAPWLVGHQEHRQ